MKIPFVGANKTARSTDANAQRTLNCYVELDDSSERAPVALYGMPGLTLHQTLGTSPVRGCVEMGSSTYWVAGNTVYRMALNGTVTTLGTILTTHGDVGMAQNGRQVIIVDGVAGWIATSSALTLIADEDFPNGVTRATSQDGYFLLCGDGSGRFYINETPRNGEGYTGADFAEAEGSPDVAVAIISSNRVTWVLGAESIEFYENTGNPDFPFERSQFVECGCAAAASVAGMDNTVFWLGRTKNGRGIVFRGDGYTPRRISDHALETSIAGYSRIDDARAFCFQMNGHSFYVLTFPEADRTWAYDASTERWIEWSWRDSTDNTDHRHRSNCLVYTNGRHLVGDWESGKVYSLGMDVYTDNGDPIRRLRRTQTMSDDGRDLFFEDIELDMETGMGAIGTDPQVQLRYSNDGGHTWSSWKTRSLGSSGQYGKNIRFGPTGRGRNRTWEVMVIEPVKFAMFGAFARVAKGS